MYGELPEGHIIRVSTALAKDLLLPECAVLNALGRYLLDVHMVIYD